MKNTSNILKDNLKVALFQLQSVDDTEKNFRQIIKIFETIKSPEKLDLVSLPENALFYKIHKHFEPLYIHSPYFKELKSIATQYDFAFHVGGSPLKDSDGKIFNASIWIDSQGIEVIYRKIHLFDFYVSGHQVRESQTYEAGTNPYVKIYKGWKFGLSICYDVRFFELFYFYRTQGVDAFLIPSAFLHFTGLSHWHTLIKARAMEFQSFALACNQAGLLKGIKGGKKQCFGHSLIVDPWGEVIEEGSPNTSDLLISDLKKQTVNEIRKRLPIEKNRQIPLKLFQD